MATTTVDRYEKQLKRAIQKKRDEKAEEAREIRRVQLEREADLLLGETEEHSKNKNCVRVKFGRFRGKPIHLVPSAYLEWCLAQQKPSRQMKALQKAARKQLRWREQQPKSKSQKVSAKPQVHKARTAASLVRCRFCQRVLPTDGYCEVCSGANRPRWWKGISDDAYC